MQNITAAPVIRKHSSEMPSPAYTDFVSIFLDRDLNKSESEVAIRHEQAHIWCHHNSRFRKEMERKIWNIACEIEISRNIYSRNDLSVINAPRSRLFGGYMPNTIKELPDDIIIAEDIYDWLIQNKEKIPQQQQVKCGCDCSGDGGEEHKSEQSKAELVALVKSKLDELASLRQSQEDVLQQIKYVRYKQPSLSDEMDAILRHRIVRERSYRRPSRHETQSNIIEKGRFSSLKRPLVEVFVDRSGSFDGNKTKTAENVLKKVLLKYGVQVRHDIFYFGSDTLSPKDINGGGNTPYHLIVQHLANTQPKIAVVITDDDACAAPNVRLNNTKILCLPVGSSKTDFAAKVGGIDVTIN